MSLAAGTRLGPYEIISALGAGGMGEVYRARDKKLSRDVALKVLPERFALEPDRVARFNREAQVLASLNHPGIAAIYGFVEAEGIHAIVLELVDGPTLADRIALGPVPFDEAVSIAIQIAEALQAAHDQGIVHRDLKPANVSLRPDGTVKVLDFGLAKALDPVPADGSDPGATPTITSPVLTQMGVILGTAAYMSPEQAKGRAADKRSDIWAFGCVLYEMLTGRPAFVGEGVSDTLASVLRGEPDWNALPAEVPPLVRTCLQRCLEKDRRRRVADASTALFAIEAARGVPGTLTPLTARPRPLWRRALPVLVAAMAAAALGAFVMWRLTPLPPKTVTQFSFTLAEGQRLFNAGRHLLAISPDGMQMVYVANQQLYLRSIAELEAQPIPGTQIPQGMTTPVFSPDGRSIAFVTVGILKRVSVTGGTPVTIADLGGPIYGMSWDGDTILIGLGRRGIIRVSANGGTPDTIVTVDDDQLAHGPQMLPGGRAVLFTLASGTGEDRWDTAKIVVQTLQSGDRTTLADAGADARYLQTGHVVYANSGVLFAVRFDAERLAALGEPARILEGVRRAYSASDNTGAAHFSVSNSGSLIYLTGPVSAAASPRDLALMDRKGAVLTLKLPARPYEFPRLSPDGTRVAVGTDDGRDAIVWIQDLAGARSMRRLTLDGRNRFPIWSADGERVAYQSDREGDLGIFWQRTDGGGTAERLTRSQPGEVHIPIAWAPTGQALLFTVVRGTTFALWTFSGSDRKAAPFGGVQSAVLPNASFSPDGRWVVYESAGRSETRGRAVFVQPFPSTGERQQVGAGGAPLWLRDGRQLLFAESGTVTELTLVNLTTRPTLTFGERTRVPRQSALAARGGSNAPRNWDIADDLRQIGVVDPAETVPQFRVVVNWAEELKAQVPGSR